MHDITYNYITFFVLLANRRRILGIVACSIYTVVVDILDDFQLLCTYSYTGGAIMLCGTHAAPHCTHTLS